MRRSSVYPNWLDVVALDSANRRIRFGSCKRAATAHTGSSLAQFHAHIAAFLATRDHRELREWQQEKAVFSSL
jgi:hypothetical protein